MNTIGTIASIIAAIGTIISIWYARRLSKGNIRRRIEKKQQKIRELDIQLVNLYGLDRGRCHPITPLDLKIEKLQAEIEDLQKEL